MIFNLKDKEIIRKKIISKIKLKALTYTKIFKLFNYIKNDDNKIKSVIKKYEEKIEDYLENNYTIEFENLLFHAIEKKIKKITNSQKYIMLIRYLCKLFLINFIDICLITKLLKKEEFLNYKNDDISLYDNDLFEISNKFQNKFFIITLFNIFYFSKQFNSVNDLYYINIYLPIKVFKEYMDYFNIWIKSKNNSFKFSPDKLNSEFNKNNSQKNTCFIDPSKYDNHEDKLEKEEEIYNLELKQNISIFLKQNKDDDDSFEDLKLNNFKSTDSFFYKFDNKNQSFEFSYLKLNQLNSFKEDSLH